MKKRILSDTLLQIFRTRKRFVLGILISLILETVISLGLPGILSKIIDGLGKQTITWLVAFILFFLAVVVVKGFATVLNSYLSEKMGRSVCDEIRKELLKKLFQFSVSQHKMSKTGDFFEKIEGDVNVMVGFFSNMLIDIMSSSFMIVGILVVFLTKSLILGGIFCVIAVLIFVIFIGTQKSLSALWNDARVSETKLFGEFSEDVYAAADVKGIGKEDYIHERFHKDFAEFEQKQVKASFWGNLPATVFFSLLNVAEGIALLIGVQLLNRGRLSIGELYLLTSYVGLLNMPFFHLKYQFAQMPMSLAALKRVNSIFEMESQEDQNEEAAEFSGNEIVFSDVSFGYNQSRVLSDISFTIGSNENVLIEGRTGCGKSTILHLIAGLYVPDCGKILIGGKEIREFNRRKYVENVFYISQFYPIIEDTLLNNLVRFYDNYEKQSVELALKITHMDQWMEETKIGLEDTIKPEDFTVNEAQILAWTAALIAKSRILLVDEFDASIDDKILTTIDTLLEKEFTGSTIIMVSHKNRSALKFHKKIHMEESRIQVETC